MGAADLLAKVAADGLEVSAQGGRLVIKGPESVRDRWREALVRAKGELLAELGHQAAASCAGCRHRTQFGNCAQPVEAGLAKTFGLVRHAEGGADCTVFEQADVHVDVQVDALEARLTRLLAMGAIDQGDATLARLRHREDSRAWDCLLDACEHAVTARHA